MWDERFGREVYDVVGLKGELRPLQRVTVHARREDGSVLTFQVVARLDTRSASTDDTRAIGPRQGNRATSAITDAAGHFSLNFQPLANEAGSA